MRHGHRAWHNHVRRPCPCACMGMGMGMHACMHAWCRPDGPPPPPAAAACSWPSCDVGRAGERRKRCIAGRAPPSAAIVARARAPRGGRLRRRGDVHTRPRLAGRRGAARCEQVNLLGAALWRGSRPRQLSMSGSPPLRTAATTAASTLSSPSSPRPSSVACLPCAGRPRSPRPHRGQRASPAPARAAGVGGAAAPARWGRTRTASRCPRRQSGSADRRGARAHANVDRRVGDQHERRTQPCRHRRARRHACEALPSAWRTLAARLALCAPACWADARCVRSPSVAGQLLSATRAAHGPSQGRAACAHRDLHICGGMATVVVDVHPFNRSIPTYSFSTVEVFPRGGPLAGDTLVRVTGRFPC